MTQASNSRQRDDGEGPALLAGSARNAAKGPRVLVVDASALMRRLLTRILETDSRVEVVGAARSIGDALTKVQFYRPDLIVLDVPSRDKEEAAAFSALGQMYGHIRTFVRREMDERCARLTLESLQNPSAPWPIATDVRVGSAFSGVQFAEDFLKQVWRATEPATAKPGINLWQTESNDDESVQAGTTTKKSRVQSLTPAGAAHPQALVIGSSTGGPSALSELLSVLPSDFPLPILIVQHMPPQFTKMLAVRLSKNCAMPFVEAEHGMPVLPGRGYIAPGDFHMGVTRRARNVEIILSQAEAENSCRPAVDFLFRSVAEAYVGSSIAVVLTGMGQDGLRGVRALKSKNVPVLVQDRESSVVWGMPGAIAEAGLADHVLPLTEIAAKILGLL